VRWLRYGLGGLGLAAMAFAIHGALTDDGEHLSGHLAFLFGVLVADDLILLPMAIGVGWLLTRYLPAWARGGVQVGLFISAIVTAVAFPFVLGAGRLADNPSKFPRDYGHGLLIVLAVVWLGIAVWLAFAYHRSWSSQTRSRSGIPSRTRPAAYPDSGPNASRSTRRRRKPWRW